MKRANFPQKLKKSDYQTVVFRMTQEEYAPLLRAAQDADRPLSAQLRIIVREWMAWRHEAQQDHTAFADGPYVSR